ncbi:unnamed protein product [Lactuca saligna]|uniref:Uncharacterized protein n=1 Tax=Lactuca saligna TaxID=75948 RepID=A0AA35VB47_LACSI|nr:unnamed protein product [Lactuca saligna]
MVATGDEALSGEMAATGNEAIPVVDETMCGCVFWYALSVFLGHDGTRGKKNKEGGVEMSYFPVNDMYYADPISANVINRLLVS